MSTWLFNLDPSLDPNQLSIVPIGGAPPSRVRVDENEFNHAGARFDLAISFPDQRHDRFDGGDASEFLISWRRGAPVLPLTPESFDFTGAGSRERGRARTRPLFTVAHVQGVEWCDEDDSAWVTALPALQPPPEPIPEPGTLLLVGTGLLRLAGLRRRRSTISRSRTS